MALLEQQASDATSSSGRHWLGIGGGGRASTLPAALWTGRMGPWTQAVWAVELARRSGGQAEVRAGRGHLSVEQGGSVRSLCEHAPLEGDSRRVGDAELVARALLELHPEGLAAASRIARWSGPAHGIFGPTGDQVPPEDPCTASPQHLNAGEHIPAGSP